MAGNGARAHKSEGEKRGPEQELTADPAACSAGSEKSPLLQPAAGAAGPECQFLPDRAESDMDDPDLGAAALEDDAEGGGGEAGGSGLGASLEDWPDDDAGKSAPLNLEKSAAASIVGSAETSATARRIDLAADLREAMEGNAREEQEAARLEKAEAERAEAAALKKLADAEVATAAKNQAKEAARRQSAIFITPLNSAPPPPEFVAQTGEAGGEHPVMERDSGDVTMPDVIVPRPPPSEEARDKQPADPPALPAGDEMATGLTPGVPTPTRRRLAKAASAPRPLETGAASSSIPDTEATSAAPTGWVRGGGTGPPNKAILDVQAKLRAEADALKNCNKAFLESREAIRVCFLLLQANAALQQQLGEANTVMRAKEVECGKLAEEHFFPGHSDAANQAIEADHEGRRAEGAQIAANAPQTLSEQLLSIEARLRPAHRMLRHLQCVGA
nr:myristoylated alanine-rich C-kinase substrate-like [Aegilops tauschii subsp. strangulata]